MSLYVAFNPFVLSFGKDKFHKNVKKVMSMGISPSTAVAFMKALRVISLLGSSIWTCKMECCREYGWTADDFFGAFRKNPGLMQLSEKNISSKMEFIVNKMALVEPAYLASVPGILSYSMENRIIPRGSVVKVLLLKGLITREDFSLSTVIMCNNKRFLDKFVVAYQPQVPNLLSIFEGKMGSSVTGLGELRKAE